MKKRIVLVLVALLCMSVLLCFAASAEEISGTCGENLTWTFKDGTLTISGTGEMDDYKRYDKPWVELYADIHTVIVEEGVTAIGAHAFSGQEQLKNVSLPDSLEKIGQSALAQCGELLKIEIPANVKEIGYEAFWYSYNLQLVTFTGDMPVFQRDVFSKVNSTIVYPGDNTTWTEEAMGKVTKSCYWIPSTRTYDSGTFGTNDLKWEYDNGKLTISGDQWMRFSTGTVPGWIAYRGLVEELVLADGIQNVYYSAFTSFRFLKKVTLADTITSIEQNAFNQCDALEEVNIPASVKYLYAGAFSRCSSLKELTIPADIEEIAENVFAGCNSLETVRFLGKMPLIRENAFTNPNTVIYYPPAYKSWSESAIEALRGTSVPEEMKFEAYGEGAAADNNNSCGENLTWTYKDGVLTISGTGDMFEFTNDNPPSWDHLRDKVEKIIINEGVTNIGRSAFRIFSALKDVVIPDTVIEIEGGSFAACKKLKKITIPDSVTKIGETVFYDCTGLTEVHIGSGLTSLGDNVFDDDCASMKKIYFHGDMPKWMLDSLDDVKATVYYPAGNDTWDKGKMEEISSILGTNITWKPYCYDEHSYGDWVTVKEPTEEEEGRKEKTCSVCGDVKSKSIDKLEPAPTEPAPTEPAPTEPAPTEPAPTEPAPTEPAPTEPAPTEPAPTEPAPTQPAGTEPEQTELAPTEPAPTEKPQNEPKNGSWGWIAAVLILVAGGAAVLVLGKKKK